jgi:hypothetical protein
MLHYSDPVSRLLNLDKPEFGDWLNYIDTFGFNATHIPELIGMLGDRDLHADDSDAAEAWAPLHAWRALGQLKANQAIPTLFSIVENYPDDDWAREEIRTVCELIGEAAIEPVRNRLITPHEDVHINIAAVECLEEIAIRHPDVKTRCVQILADCLQTYRGNDSELNSFLIASLVALEAALGHLELIAAAFEADCVDKSLRGDFEDLQIDLGLLKERITPRRNYLFEKYPELENLAKTISSINLTPDNKASKKSNIEPQKMTYIEPNTGKPRVGRNDPCPCGSGKKYKKCCMV